MTTTNWASSDAGARLIDFSSEVEGCEAENVLNSKLSSIWLSEEGLPQWFCLSLNGIQNMRDVVIRTVGWHCWHPYSTNPKIVTLHVSPDGSKFKRWDSFRATAPQKGTQLFCCAPISSAVYPFLAFEITDVFGGNQTYMNRLYLYSDEISSSPQVSETSNKSDEISLNAASGHSSVNSDSMEMNSLLHKLEHSLGMDVSADTYFSDPTGAISASITMAGSAEMEDSFRHSHAELRRRIQDKARTVRKQEAEWEQWRGNKGEWTGANRSEATAHRQRENRYAAETEGGEGEVGTFVQQRQHTVESRQVAPTSNGRTDEKAVSDIEVVFNSSNQSSASREADDKSTPSPAEGTATAENVGGRASHQVVAAIDKGASARIRGVIHSMAEAEDERERADRTDGTLAIVARNDETVLQARHKQLVTALGIHEEGEEGDSSDSLPLQKSVGDKLNRSRGRSRERVQDRESEEGETNDSDTLPLQPSITRKGERRLRQRSESSKSPDGILRRIRQAASRVGVDVSFTRAVSADLASGSDSSPQSAEQTMCERTSSHSAAPGDLAADKTVADRIGALESKMSDLILALDTFKSKSTVPPVARSPLPPPRSTQRDNEAEAVRTERVMQETTDEDTLRRRQQLSLGESNGLVKSDRPAMLLGNTSCCCGCAHHSQPRFAQHKRPRAKSPRRCDDTYCHCPRCGCEEGCSCSTSQPPPDTWQTVLSLESALRSLLHGEDAHDKGHVETQKSRSGWDRDSFQRSEEGGHCTHCIGDRRPPGALSSTSWCTSGHHTQAHNASPRAGIKATHFPPTKQSSSITEKEILSSHTCGKGPGGVFRPYLQAPNDQASPGSSSDGVSGYDPGRVCKSVIKPLCTLGGSTNLRTPASTSLPTGAGPPVPREPWRCRPGSLTERPDCDVGESLEEIVEALQKKILLRTVKEAELKMIRRIKDT